MLNRPISGALRQLPRQVQACHRCTCRCGASFSTSAPTSVRRAPGTIDREARLESRAMSASEARKIAEAKDQMSNISHNYRWHAIKNARKKGWIGIAPQTADKFLNGFSELTKTRLRSNIVDSASLKKLVETHGLEERDLIFLCMFLLQSSSSGGRSAKMEGGGGLERRLGNQLIYSLSAAGYAEATIRVMAHVFVSSETKPALLRTAQHASVRGQLQKLAREGDNYRAMVLEGKIAHRLGDKEYAIKLWWKAMDGALAEADWYAAQRAAGTTPERTFSNLDLTELSSPWVELAKALYERAQTVRDRYDPKYKIYWDEVEQVLNIGLEQDDPTMYYYAATFHAYRDDQGEWHPTSMWLYCMTKAATSGIPIAAHELGKYYAHSGWRYIEDEPPDHVKPTPFDTFPEPGALVTTWTTLKSLFSPQARVPQHQSERENLFHTAVFPSTAKDRMDLGMRWLDVAISYQYAPAYLEKARLHLTETLWVAADAPADHLSLSPSRYLYKSEEEKGICEYNGELREWQPPANAKDPPNPYYSEDKAKECLRQVFNAATAISIRENSIAKLSSSRRPSTSHTPIEVDDLENDFSVGESGSLPDIFKFWKYNEVLHMWIDQASELRRQAEGICDERGWDLWDERGALLYRCGFGAVGREVDKLNVVGTRKV